MIQRIYGQIDRVLAAICRILPGPLYRLVVRLHRMLTYGFMGVINTVVDFLVFYLLYKVCRASIEPSQAVGIICASAHGYMLNSKLTFSEGRGRSRAQLVQYVGIDVVLTVLSSIFMGWVEHKVTSVFLPKLIMTVAMGLLHYIIYKLLVFRIKKEDKQ